MDAKGDLNLLRYREACLRMKRFRSASGVVTTRSPGTKGGDAGVGGWDMVYNYRENRGFLWHGIAPGKAHSATLCGGLVGGWNFD